MKLFMLLLGSTPTGRFIEQHDIFFGFAETLKDLVPDIIKSWPEAEGNIHIDAWREVIHANGYKVTIDKINEPSENNNEKTYKLFFINLGGYKQNEFEEYHYKMLLACENKSMAIRQAKETAFYKHTGFKGAESHIDDKYGIDVDDIYQIEDVLSEDIKKKYSIRLAPSNLDTEDELHLGYFMLEKL